MDPVGLRAVLLSPDKMVIPQAVPSRRAVLLSVAFILVLEIALFAPSFGMFFCGDSLYFLSRRVESSEHLQYLFTHLDSLQSYRPLTHVVFTYLMYPLSGLDPRGYHLMSLGAHLLTSLLVFALLRLLVRSPAAALAGLFYFGAHGVNFYITYDATFLPDFGMGLTAAGSLLAYALSLRRNSPWWKAASVALFVPALLFKESAVMLPVGLAVVHLLARREERPPAVLRSLLPHLAVTTGYLGFQLYLHSGWLYPSAVGPYRLSFAPGTLVLKLKYLPWLFNLPADLERRGWRILPPAILMLPALAWIFGRLREGWRADRRALLLCGGWAAAALLPVLFLTQVPMKHNIYLPVLALAMALAISVDGTAWAGKPMRRRGAWLVLPMALAVAVQVHADLRYSWVGEGSRVAQQSLEAVRRAYPRLPPGAVLYLLPARIRGNISWYFDGGALFRLFYNDPTLHMRFADLRDPLPDDHRRRTVLIFRFYKDRLYDVTREYNFAGAEHGDWLTQRLDSATISNPLSWKPRDMPDGRPAWFLMLARQDSLRRALVMLPGTQVRFPIGALRPDSILHFGITLAGDWSGGSSGRIAFESQGLSETLFRLPLDALFDADAWWDVELDLSHLSGRSGTLLVENNAGREAALVAWSGLRIVPRSSVFSVPESPYGIPLRERGWSLTNQFEDAQTTFDTSEVYPEYTRFDTPTGKPQFIRWATPTEPRRLSMVTIAGARVRFAIPALPRGAVLEVSASHGGDQGDGARGLIFWEQAGSRKLLFDEMVFPRQTRWLEREISLAAWEGQSGTLSFECSSGPAGNTVSDWFAWGKLRIISRPPPGP